MLRNSRRTFLQQASLAVAAAQLGPWANLVGAQTSEVIGETAYGRIRGTAIGDIKIFKGVPYGASTAGRNRFMPPVKPAAWTGVRDALAYGPSTPQTVPGPNVRLPQPESEDCLVLNVFTPGLADGRKRPVMLWLHGGGFSSGSGSSARYDGTSLARTHDVVLVSINHRLNAFGFTYLGDVAPEFAPPARSACSTSSPRWNG